MKQNKRKSKFIGTSVQRKTLLLVLVAAIIPAAIIAVCLYYLIFYLLAQQLGIPEAIAYNLLPVARKVNLIIIISLPITLLAIWLVALELSHSIAGPIYRLEKELSARIAGKKSGAIKLRKNDELKDLVTTINKLICR